MRRFGPFQQIVSFLVVLVLIGRGRSDAQWLQELYTLAITPAGTVWVVVAAVIILLLSWWEPIRHWQFFDRFTISTLEILALYTEARELRFDYLALVNGESNYEALDWPTNRNLFPGKPSSFTGPGVITWIWWLRFNKHIGDLRRVSDNKRIKKLGGPFCLLRAVDSEVRGYQAWMKEFSDHEQQLSVLVTRILNH